MADFGADPALVASQSSQSSLSQPEALVPNALASELLARAYEDGTFETMPWTVRNTPRHALAETVQVALRAIEAVLTEIAGVDYWEGNCADLIEWRFAPMIAQGIEARRAATENTDAVADESPVAISDAPNE